MKVYYGLLKEPDLQLPTNEEDEEENAGGDADKQNADKPKKKKPKKDPWLSKKTKSDPNAPPPGRMPLPSLLVILSYF